MEETATNELEEITDTVLVDTAAEEALEADSDCNTLEAGGLDV